MRVVQRRMGTFLLLVFASLLTARLRLPWQLGSLAFALLGLGIAIYALVYAVRRPGLREQIAPMLVVAIVFTSMLTLSTASMLVLWSEQLEHQRCLDHAVTISARTACDTAYEESVEQRLERLRSPGTGD